MAFNSNQEKIIFREQLKDDVRGVEGVLNDFACPLHSTIPVDHVDGRLEASLVLASSRRTTSRQQRGHQALSSRRDIRLQAGAGPRWGGVSDWQRPTFLLARQDTQRDITSLPPPPKQETEAKKRLFRDRVPVDPTSSTDATVYCNLHSRTASSGEPRASDIHVTLLSVWFQIKAVDARGPSGSMPAVGALTNLGPDASFPRACFPQPRAWCESFGRQAPRWSAAVVCVWRESP
ncbi:uncharacterized protein [Narcine bancroftii]|uniref:uncharacterized protein n=1 Tax=Narcine bancroftii TaxID=1343680 RepID=UPI00383114C7